MKIMCLNGWGGKLHADILPYLRETAPDVLCLQEVVHTPTARQDWLTYRDGDHILPQRARFFDEVCAALPEHAATFCPAAQGVLWDDNVSIPSQWGLATFVHCSHSVIGQSQGFVHKGFSAHGYGDHPRSRSVHSVRLYDFSADRTVTITHMHGLRDLDGKHDTPARKTQAERFLALHQIVAEPDDTSILCGDFNVGPDSDTIKLLENAGFTELVTRHAPEGTRTSHYRKPARFADYMAVSNPGAVTSFEVVRSPEVSDHCPLLLTL